MTSGLKWYTARSDRTYHSNFPVSNFKLTSSCYSASSDEVDRVTDSLFNNKASHVDDMPVFALRQVKCVISPVVAFLIVMSFEKGVFPEQLIAATVIPL